jgi:endonuclease/exonuclease/phosphatase (EEP) superfamily protein YafD
MTWNLLEGGSDAVSGPRHDLIGEVLRAERPDVLVACEAGDVDAGPLADALRGAGLSGRATAGADPGYDVAVLVRPPSVLEGFEEVASGGPSPFAVARVAVPGLGSLGIVAAHLHHLDVEARLRQAERAASLLDARMPRAVVGDLNALSDEDGLDAAVLGTLPEHHGARHAHADGRLATGVPAVLRAAGLRDAWRVLHGGRGPDANGHTVPTDIPQPPRFGPLRLDYAFLSTELLARLRACRVVRSAAARRASDHLPLVVELADDAAA